MKVGIIRCQQTEDMCPGNTDFAVARENKGVFATSNEPVEVIGFVSCGGCPGKKSVTRAEMMVNRGAQVVVLASCITRGNPIGFACPHRDNILAAIKKRIGEKAEIWDWTH
ncbi:MULTISPECIES: CGGC domain-containing protein [Carboxydothermus]|uniref:CGGC domain-containing protein n=2 Tax=Carboxydothermus TaxID=129957 RepID=A0A1L8CT21_9THEO|nr:MULTISPECIES: CGGC domain-containing protein [Carboxydothermus]NYE56627.1 putative metal-binding protein [Carboxydothermus ferrireducens DSM 11255]GAV21994.1 CGGC domain-containing protein [Carboxydothermus pertinax]